MTNAETMPTGLAEKQRHSARERFARAKLFWTKAAVAAWLGRPGADALVGPALRELNLARAELAQFEAVKL